MLQLKLPYLTADFHCINASMYATHTTWDKQTHRLLRFRIQKSLVYVCVCVDIMCLGEHNLPFCGLSTLQGLSGYEKRHTKYAITSVTAFVVTFVAVWLRFNRFQLLFNFKRHKSSALERFYVWMHILMGKVHFKCKFFGMNWFQNSKCVKDLHTIYHCENG